METGSLTPETGKVKPIIGHAEQLMLLDDTAKLKETVEQEKPDMLYFLDRSARPLFWYLRATYPKETVFPKTRFLNIGDEKGESFDSVIENSDFPELQTDSKFTPQKVMIIDEFRFSGESLKRATQIVKKLSLC